MAAEKKLRLKKLADRSSLSICCELFEKLQDGLIACSPDRKIIFLNSYAKKITGLKNSDEKKQVLIDEILSEENSGIIESIFSKILNGSKNEIVIQNKQNANENLIKWLTFKFSLLKTSAARRRDSAAGSSRRSGRPLPAAVRYGGLGSRAPRLDARAEGRIRQRRSPPPRRRRLRRRRPAKRRRPRQTHGRERTHAPPGRSRRSGWPD